MSLTPYPTLRLKLTVQDALKLQFLPAIPGTNAAAAAAAAEAAAAQAEAAAATAVAATANKVDKSGDVMTGFLTLNADPTIALHAATKQYVDSHSAGIPDGDKGDITTSSGGTVWTINADAVTYAKIQNVSVTARFLGRFSGGAGDVEEGTGTQATALLDVFTSTLKGLAPLSGGGTTNFLRADGSWAAPPGGGGGAPVGAEYITASADATLTNERVLTNTASITWDFTTPGQAKASTAAGGGNVSNSGTPTAAQYAKWVTATTIQGVAAGTVLTDIGAQPLDADLTAIAALTGTNTIYYRSAANTWAAVTIGTGLTFTGGTLAATGGGGSVNISGTPVAGQVAEWTNANTIQGVSSVPHYTASSTAPVSPTAGDFWYDLSTGVLSIYINDGDSSQWVMVSPSGGGSQTVVPQGRLTLQTGVPVMTATQSAKTTFFYTPHVGNQIGLYNGTSFVPTTFAELSAATTDTTKSPAAIGASKVNDWFVWLDGSVVRLGHGPDWSSDTARSAGTALTMVNGIWLNNAAITNGPAASRGTYVGTTRSNASSQLDWIFGGITAGGTAAFFGVWNTYNRQQFSCIIGETMDSWTYNATTIRAANASAAMRGSFVRGLDQDITTAEYKLAVSNPAGNNGIIGVGLDTTTAFSGLPGWQATFSANVGTIGTFAGLCGLGFHFISANEVCANTVAASTFYGDNGNAGLFQGGLVLILAA